MLPGSMATTYFSSGDPGTLDTDPAPDFPSAIPQSAALPPALDLAADFDQKLAQHHQETIEKIDTALIDFDNFAPSANPTARRRAIGSAFIAHKLGVTPAHGLAYDRQRATIAKELFNGAGAESDDAFFTEIQKDALSRKHRRDLENNLLTESLVSQLAQAVDSVVTQGPRTSPTGIGPRDWIGDIRNPRGADVRPFEAWQEKAKQLPGYDPKKAADYLSEWNLSRQAVADRIAPFRAELYDVFNSFRDSGFSNDAARQAYLNLPEGQHSDFLDALGLLARTLPAEEQATFWSNLKKQASRDTSSNLRSVGEGARILAMEGLAQAAGATGPAGNASPEDQAAITKRIYAERNFRADVERIAAEDYDPIKTLAKQGSFLEAAERGAYAGPGAITYTATAAVPFVGQAAVFSSMTDQAYTQQRRTFMDAGMSDAEASAAAAQMAPLIAFPQAMLEKVGASAVLGKLPFLNRTVNALGNRVTNRAAAFGLRTAGVGSFETGIEMAQDLIPDIAQDIAAALNKDLPGTDWEKTFENYGHQTLTTFVAVLPLAIIGAATNISAEDRRRTITQASDLELQAAGIAKADIEAIRQAEQEGPASTLAAVDRALAGIDPTSEEALDGTQELAETLDRQQQAANRARTAGILPRFTTGPEGFTVIDADTERTIGQAATAEDALRLASEHTTAIDLDDADQVAYLASLLTGAQEAALTGTTQDTETTADVRPFEEQTVAEAIAESEQQEKRIFEQMAARESLGTPDNSAPLAQIVLGQYQPDFSKGVRRDVLRINGGASVLTVFHEKTHQSYRTALETGALTREEVVSFFQTLDTVLAGKTTRDGQPLQFLPADPSQITDTLLDEAMSELMEAEILRTRKTSGKYGVPAGIVSQNLKALGRLNARVTGKLADFIRAIRAYFGQVFQRAQVIQRGIKEGAIDPEQYEGFLNRLLGIDEALDYDQLAREAEAAAYGEDWTPSDTTEDAPFSIRPQTAETLAADLIGKIGPQRLRLEQPQASYEDKQQLLFDFSKSILGEDQAGTQPFDNHRGLSRLQRIRHRLAENLKVNLRVDFLGQTIASPADLVEKAQALRNPAFETFYLFAVDDGGKLLDVLALSSRCPCSAPIAEGQNVNWTSAIDQHKAFLKQAGASSYIVLHNHPSGDPTPSTADRRFTEKHAEDMASEGFTFLDHVVINHRKFTSIGKYGHTAGLEYLDDDLSDDPFLAKDWAIGDLMDSPSNVANEGRRMLAGESLAPGELIVLAADSRLQTVGAYRATTDSINKLTIAQAIEQGELDGSTRLLVYGEAKNYAEATLVVRDLLAKTPAGLITDIAIAQDDGSIFSAVEHGMMPLGRNKYGQDLSETGGQRIQEPSSFSLGRNSRPYKDRTAEEQGEPLTETEILEGVEDEPGTLADVEIDDDKFSETGETSFSIASSVPLIDRASLKGKKKFIYFSDQTRVGVYTGLDPDSGINIDLQGGPSYPYIDAHQGPAGWAFTTEGMFTRFNKRVNETDGIGLTTLYSKENLRANPTFLKAYAEEVKAAIAKGTLKPSRYLKEMNALRMALKKSAKWKQDAQWTPKFSKAWKTVDEVEAALAATTFEVRASMFFGYDKDKKGKNKGSKIGADALVAEGFPNISKMVDLFADPAFDGLEQGTIVGAVQFEKGQETSSRAQDINAENHLSYPVVIKGRGIGFFSDPVHVTKVLKDSDKEGRALTRSAETSMAVASFSLGRAAVTPTANTQTFPTADGGLIGPASFSISAYHGTPHKVDRFSTANIGTGEGAQAYGWGLYFAQNQSIAKYYQETLGASNRTEQRWQWNQQAQFPEVDAVLSEDYGWNTQEELVAQLRERADAFEDAWGDPMPDNDYKLAADLIESGGITVTNVKKGNLYTVTLKAEPEELLDWDKPLSEQSEKVKGAFSKVLEQSPKTLPDGFDLNRLSGQGFLSVAGAVEADRLHDEQVASRRMAAAGIKGLRYLDGNSRSDGQGSYNYVIFSDADIEITEENGQPVNLQSSPYSLGFSGIAANLSADALGRVTDPVRRAQIMQRIARNLEQIQLASERLELTIGEKRLAKSLQREARVRAALRQEELENEAYARHLSILADEDLATLSAQPIHSELLDPTTDKNGRRRYAGRLRSKSAAAKAYPESFNPSAYDGAEGISPMLWGGTLDPDQAAQELYEAGLINEPSPDALWDALSREAQTVDAMRRALANAKRDLQEARATATKEAQLFLDEELGKQEVNFSPRQEILRALATLDGILKGLPPEIRGKVGGYAQLAQLSTNEARLSFLKQRLDIADKELEKWLKEQYDNELNELLANARPDKTEAGKRIKGKLTADVHSFFELIREARFLTVQEAEAEARGLETLIEMDADGNFPEVEDHLETFVPVAANLYRLFGGWNKADAARKEEAFLTAQELYIKGLREAYGEAQAKREKRQRQRNGLIHATGELDNDAQKRRDKLVADTAKKTGRAKQILYSLLSWEDLLRHAFGDNSPEAKLLADWERRADFAKTQAVDHKLDQLESLFADLAGGKFKGEQLRAELAAPGTVTWTDWKGRKQAVSQLEAITATLLWRQEDGKRHMRGHLNAAERPVGEWHYRQEDIDAIDAALTPEARAIRLHLSEQYAAEYDKLNPVFRSLYGVNMPRHKNYAPITVTGAQSAGGQVQDPLGGLGMTSVSLTPGSLRNRSNSAIAEPKLSDALQVYLSHVRQMEHWMAYAEFTTEARAMLNSRTVGNAVEQRTGKEPLNVLRSWVDYFAQGGVIDASAHLAINGLFQRMISRASSMALVGRVSVLAIQSTQLGAAAYEMPTADYITRFAKLMSGRLAWKDAMESPYIQRRLSQMPAVVQQGLQGLKGGKPTRLRYAMRQVGELIGGADALFTAGTYAILLDYHRTQGRAMGLKGQQLEAYAHNTAGRTTDRVAQPTRAGGRSFYEVTSTNPAMKMVWAFASEPRQKLAITAAAFLRGDKKAGFRSALITWLFSGLVAAVIRSTVRDARNGEDDELFDEKNWDPKRMALSSLTGPAAGLPILGNAMESMLFAMAGEYLPDGNLLDSGTRAATSAQNLPDYLDGDKDIEDALKDIEAILTGVGLVSNQAAAGTSAMHIARDLWGFLTNWTD